MGQLEDMNLFISIVESGGIGKAAEQLGIAKSAVSRRLHDLEQRLSTQLISRTTRRSNLTDEGREYYQRALNIVEEVSELNEQTSGNNTRVEGTLKISAPLSFGILHLSDVLDEFAKKHKGLNFEIDFSDRHVDLVQEGFELGIRIGQLKDSNYRAKRISPIRHCLAASKSYLEHYGTPKTLEDLHRHKFIKYNTSPLMVIDPRGDEQPLPMPSIMHINNGDVMVAMAKKGHGIISSPTFIAYKALMSGELIPILPNYSIPIMTAYAIYPRNRFLPQRCRKFIDFIANRFGEEPYWDQMLQDIA